MRSCPNRIFLALAVTMIAFSATQPATASAGDEARIRELIQSAEIVPIDYRQHVSIMDKGDNVLISVYKAPDAQQTDCKIDAILMAEKVLEAVPATRLVQVFFYDLAAQDRIWQVDVSTQSVADYAHGKLTKEGIIKAAKLTNKAANTLATTYGGQSYKQIVQKLGVLEGPAQDLRASALVRIDDLASKGQDTSDLRKKYLHIEDLTRRGDLITMRHALRELSDTLNELASGGPGANDRAAKLESMVPSGANQ